MSGIKSALELAMERTAGLKIDAEELRRQQAHKEGKVMANRWLAATGEDEELRRPFTELAEQSDRAFRLAGVKEVLLARVKFPAELPEPNGRLASMVELLPLSKASRNKLTQIVQQLGELQRQFSDHRQQIKEHLIGQIKPFLRQKEQQIEQQTGRFVHLTPENEPQFRDMLAQQIEQLESELGPYFQQIRQEMEKVLA